MTGRRLGWLYNGLGNQVRVVYYPETEQFRWLCIIWSGLCDKLGFLLAAQVEGLKIRFDDGLPLE